MRSGLPWKSLTVVALAWLVVLSAYLFASPRHWLSVLDLLASQMRYHVRGELPPADYLKVVGITEHTISLFQDSGVYYPFPRDWHARALRRLADAGARVVVVDIIFAGEDSWDEGEDEALRDAIRYCRSKGCEVVLAAAIEQTEVSGARIETLIRPADVIMEGEPHLGLSNTWDKLSYKQIEQVKDSIELPSGNQPKFYYSQAVEAFRLFCAQSGRDFQSEITRAQEVEPARGETDRDKYFFRVNYCARPSTFAGHEYSFERLFPELWLTEDEDDAAAAEPDADPDEAAAAPGAPAPRELTADEQAALTDIFGGAVVFTGSLSRLDNDYFNTPFGQMFGVETNAQAFDTLARRRLVRTVPNAAVCLILLLLALSAWAFSLARPIWRGAVLAAVGLGVLGAINIALFVFGRIELTLSTSGLGLLLPYVAGTVYGGVSEELERRRIRAIFGRYVSDAIVEQIIANPELAGLGGVERTVAVLFNDIRNYSTITERLSPAQIVEFLNIYLGEVSEVIQANNGFVDKYLGDGLMAFFGAPVPTADPCGDAIRAALEMIRVLHDRVHPHLEQLELPKFLVGVGIHVGSAVMGNIGSEKRHDYTLIGDAVNVASRVESQTKEFGWAVIVTRDVVDRTLGGFDFQLVGERQVKGREQPVAMFRVVDPARPDSYRLKPPPPVSAPQSKEHWTPEA